MNFLFVALVSVILATGVFNTEPKDGEGNKVTEIIVKESMIQTTYLYIIDKWQ